MGTGAARTFALAPVPKDGSRCFDGQVIVCLVAVLRLELKLEIF